MTRRAACAWKGCGNAGEYRAPRDQELRSYFMFCLEHVRTYNAGWDYHKGCTAAELEALAEPMRKNGYGHYLQQVLRDQVY